MGHKRIILTVLTAAALFGAAISGCNRDREPRVASASQRRAASLGSRPQAEFAEGLAVRPAEVLSASAHRGAPARRMAQSRNRRAEQQQYSRARRPEQQYREREYAARRNYTPARPQFPVVVRSGDLARYEPLPEPIPASELYAARTQTYQAQSGPRYASAGAPPVYNQTSVPMPQYARVQPAQASPAAFVSEPYTLVPSRTQPGTLEKVYADGDRRGQPVQAHPSPELTMARAQLQGPAPLGDRVAMPAQQPARMIEVPLPTPDSFPVPIPELEPIRYSRAPAGQTMQPVAMTPVRAVQQPQAWQQQIWQPQPAAPAQQAQIQPQRPLPPLPSAYVWDSQSGGAAPAQQPAPTQTIMTAEPYQTVPALPAVTPAIQGWVASPTTAMRFF